jgi:hypothetical protein
MIHIAHENQTSWLPAVRITELPQRLPIGVRLHLREGEVGIESQGLVGAIPLLNGDTLQIVPKIGQVNFLRLLFRAEGLQPDLAREFESFVAYSQDEPSGVETLAARRLMFGVAEVLSRSPMQGRRKARRRDDFATGKVDALASALNVQCHRDRPIVSTVRERHTRVPENGVITEAVLRALPILMPGDLERFEAVADRWVSRFPRSQNLREDLDSVERGFSNGKYGGSRDYYRNVLMLSQVILGSCGYGFAGEPEFEGDAILLNSADIFERYIRGTISERYTPDGYIVSKTGIGTTSLYTDGSYELNPDIVISRDSKTLLVADAKYKIPTSSDHYQLYTYLSSYGIKSGLLLSPSFEKDDVVVKEYRTSDNFIAREIYLPMNDLDSTEAFLATILERFGD